MPRGVLEVNCWSIRPPAMNPWREGCVSLSSSNWGGVTVRINPSMRIPKLTLVQLWGIAQQLLSNVWSTTPMPLPKNHILVMAPSAFLAFMNLQGFQWYMLTWWMGWEDAPISNVYVPRSLATGYTTHEAKEEKHVVPQSLVTGHHDFALFMAPGCFRQMSSRYQAAGNLYTSNHRTVLI